jgi:hypothetical protein
MLASALEPKLQGTVQDQAISNAAHPQVLKFLSSEVPSNQSSAHSALAMLWPLASSSPLLFFLLQLWFSEFWYADSDKQHSPHPCMRNSKSHKSRNVHLDIITHCTPH